MKIIGDSTQFRERESVVSIGMFDGVHLGHRRVLQTLRDAGLAMTLPTVVVTFDPHPRIVLRPGQGPDLLVSVDDRLDLLALTGTVDHCLVLPFDRRVSEATAREFVEDVLIAGLGMRALIVGENFRCGRGRIGDIAMLLALGDELGFAVHPISLREGGENDGHPPCSSTEMRRLIESGDVARAASGLTRSHEMTGTVLKAPHRTGRDFEVSLSSGMCTPAADHYAGAIRSKHSASPWIPASIRVLRSIGPKRVSVSLIADEDIVAADGDLLALRFIERAPQLAAA